MGKLIHRIRSRRRDRRLSRELELRYRRQLDARSEAAARMADELHRS